MAEDSNTRDANPDKVKSVTELTLDDILHTGLPLSQARIFYRQLHCALSHLQQSPLATWHYISKELLTPAHPHPLHRLMYYSIYKNWNRSVLGPPIAWFPTQDLARRCNLGKLMESHGMQLLGSSYYSPVENFAEFYRFSVDHPDLYLPLVFDKLSLKFHVQPRCIFDNIDKSRPGGTWLPGAVLNAAECCLMPKPSIGKTDGSKAIVWRDESHENSPLLSMTLAELRAKVHEVANALDLTGFQKGEAIAVNMPMNTNSIIIYLSIILAGYVVVSVADSFVSAEIATRLRLSNAKAVFTQDHIIRGGKKLPLYSRVVEAQAPMAIVLPADGKRLHVELREKDIAFDGFLSATNSMDRPWEYQAVQQPIETYTNILFSSGTSGEPKAIPWSHLQPIRIAVESWAHNDVRRGDVFVWPTNLGWMVGPLLIYSCLLNAATIGIYNGSPLTQGFGKFVQDASVTILGTVPTIVKSWRKTRCMDGLNWSSIRVFLSTGEASSIDDDLWLSAKGWYSPVIEACGGTELAGGYAHGCLLQPQAYAMFSTPPMTISFVILDDQGKPYPDDVPCIGEAALMPMMGASHTLLNADHNTVYYKDMPFLKGKQLRRHGDIFERTVGGFYKAHGRADDTMNLGGIKTSAIEIEGICNKANEQVLETAAVAVPSLSDGPDQLVIYAVLREGSKVGVESLKAAFSEAIHANLNPLFKVSSVIVVDDLPRTATNKIMRRILRSQIMQGFYPKSRL